MLLRSLYPVSGIAVGLPLCLLYKSSLYVPARAGQTAHVGLVRLHSGSPWGSPILWMEWVTVGKEKEMNSLLRTAWC